MLKEWLTDREFELIRITLIDLPEGSFIDDEEFIKTSGFDRSLQQHLVNKWPNISPGSGEAIAIIQCLRQLVRYCHEMDMHLESKINCGDNELNHLIDKLFAFEQLGGEQLVEKFLTLSSTQTPMQFGKQDRIYPKLTPKLKKDLSTILPIAQDGLVYYPCDVVLSNGELKHNVVLVDADKYIKFWGVWPDEDSGKWEIKIDSVVSIIKSKNRLPAHVEQKLTQLDETRMGGVDFKLILKDGSEVSVCTGNIKFFLDLKSRLTLEDIADVRAVDRDEIVETEIGNAQFYWCLYS